MLVIRYIKRILRRERLRDRLFYGLFGEVLDFYGRLWTFVFEGDATSAGAYGLRGNYK